MALGHVFVPLTAQPLGNRQPTSRAHGYPGILEPAAACQARGGSSLTGIWALTRGSTLGPKPTTASLGLSQGTPSGHVGIEVPWPPRPQQLKALLGALSSEQGAQAGTPWTGLWGLWLTRPRSGWASPVGAHDCPSLSAGNSVGRRGVSSFQAAVVAVQRHIPDRWAAPLTARDDRRAERMRPGTSPHGLHAAHAVPTRCPPPSPPHEEEPAQRWDGGRSLRDARNCCQRCRDSPPVTATLHRDPSALTVHGGVLEALP